MKHVHMLAVESFLDSEKRQLMDTDRAVSLHTPVSKDPIQATNLQFKS